MTRAQRLKKRACRPCEGTGTVDVVLDSIDFGDEEVGSLMYPIYGYDACRFCRGKGYARGRRLTRRLAPPREAEAQP